MPIVGCLGGARPEGGIPAGPGPGGGPAMCGPGAADMDFLLLIFAILLTRLLLNRGSELLFLQLSTARWMRPRFPRRHGFRCAKAQPTVLHSVS